MRLPRERWFRKLSLVRCLRGFPFDDKPGSDKPGLTAGSRGLEAGSKLLLAGIVCLRINQTWLEDLRLRQF